MDTQEQFENVSNEAGSSLSREVLDDVVGMAWQRDAQAKVADSTSKKDSSEKEPLKIIENPSPNHSSRDGQPISSLVLHYTAEPEAQALRHLCDPKAGVSAHYLVGVDGTIWHLVDESEGAWHAGYSYWNGRNRLNPSSVGIEIANMGNEPFPEAQMKAVAALSKDIIQRNNISPTQVVGHSDIAATSKNHKIDPGWFFDWKGLAAQGIGIWPEPTQSDYEVSRNWSNAELKQKLIDYGYTAEAELPALIGAFQRHFQPEVQKTGKEGVADAETRARLAWLLRNKS